MKKIFLILLVSAFLASCGQNNTKTPENTTQTGIIENKTQSGMTETHKMAETNSPKTEKIAKNTEKENSWYPQPEDAPSYPKAIDFLRENYQDLIKNLDKETLVSITNFDPNQGNYFLKDKNGVYFVNIIEKTIKKVEWADTKTFQLNEDYTPKDKNFVYNPETGEKYNLDAKTFKRLSFNIVRDDKDVIIWDKKVPGVEGKNFEEIEESKNYYKNDTFVYYLKNNEFVKLDLDSKNIKVEHENIIFDNKNLYVYGKKIDGIDINSLKILAKNAFKDNSSVYMEFSRNGSNVFEKPNVFDVKTFEALNSRYFKDKNGIYAYDGSRKSIIKVEGADMETFEIVGKNPSTKIKDKYELETSSKAKDKNHFYEYGIKIK